MSVKGVPTRWPRRAGAAIAVRMAVAVGPAIIALAVSWGMSAALPSGPSIVQRLLWTVTTIGISIAAGALAARALRRAAPLAWLLTIHLAFPDATPSRFATALRAGRTTDLAADLRAHRLDGQDLEAAQRIIALAAALTSHDRATRGHSERVRGYTRLIGESMGVSQEDLDKLAWAGLLHDVGKLAVDPEILNKPCGLDEDEQADMRRHPIEGARLAAPLMPWLGEWGRAIVHHHERWDGTGYPAGLSGQRISLGGRIVAVADAFEAMTAQRSYNSPRTLHQARQELVAAASSQFDPDVVRALLAVPLRRLCAIALPSVALGVLPSIQHTWPDLSESLHLTHAGLRGSAFAVAGTAAASVMVLAPSAWVPPQATIDQPLVAEAGASVSSPAASGGPAQPRIRQAEPDTAEVAGKVDPPSTAGGSDSWTTRQGALVPQIRPAYVEDGAVAVDGVAGVGNGGESAAGDPGRAAADHGRAAGRGNTLAAGGPPGPVVGTAVVEAIQSVVSDDPPRPPGAVAGAVHAALDEAQDRPAPARGGPPSGR